MGYYREQKAIAEGCKRIEMTLFTRMKVLKSEDDYVVTINWSGVGAKECSMKVEVINSEYPKYLVLSYNLSSKGCPEGKFYRYRISLIEKKSNLGKGIYYYFKCPETGGGCRVLYFAYGSPLFKSRLAYPQRIYYKIQTVNSAFYAIERTIKIKEVIKIVDKARMKTVYKGQETRTFRRLGRLRMDLNKYKSKNLKIFWSKIRIRKRLKQMN